MTHWIPRKIIGEIQEAIDADDRSCRIFYITSAGGNGKTVLLRQIGHDLFGSLDGIAAQFPWTGILDLYHSETNTNSGLEAQISQALNVNGEFSEFYDEREGYAARREAGITGPDLENERAKIAHVFADCFNKVTRWQRVVVAIDTTERIQYEIDDVQKFCRLDAESSTVKTWLIEQLKHWRNCVVLLVGRPEDIPYLASALQTEVSMLTGTHFLPRELKPFDDDETKAYFQAKELDIPEVKAVDEKIRDRLAKVTEGRPIWLDLAIEIVQHGLQFDQFCQEIMDIDIEQARAIIKQRLIEQVMGIDPDPEVRRTLRYLATARKGLDASLLKYLAGIDQVEACRRLDAVSIHGYVKIHAADNRRFLHDEMYEICDEFLLTPAEVQRLSHKIVEWYDDQIRQEENRERKKDLQVDSLFYRLRANPRDGYRWYIRQAEYAIRGIELGYDMRLRSEVISFLLSRSAIDRDILPARTWLRDEFNCDSAANWVKRLNAQGKNQRAAEIANQLLGSDLCPCPLEKPQFALARADLKAHKAQALIYQSKYEDAETDLCQVITNLENGQKPEDLAPQGADEDEGSRRNLILGRAHNLLGYLYWMQLGFYRLALKEFKAALPYFRASHLTEELANTNDNMGRVYALLRDHSRAETLVDEGLILRRNEGRDYRIGLSLNSRAILYLEFNEPHRAKRVSEEALTIFERLGVLRGIGLALITLGRSLRKLGSLYEEDIYSAQDADRFLSEAARHVERAISIFTEQVDEPVRLVEALNEMGCIYRQRFLLAQITAPNSQMTRTIYNEAVKRLDQSVKEAEKRSLWVQYADSLEDLAEVYAARQDYDKALDLLNQSEIMVPKAQLFLPKVQQQNQQGARAIEAFWNNMGKVELFRGNLIFDKGTQGNTLPASRELLKEVVLHYALSSAYFERFTGGAVGLGHTFRQLYARFKHCSYADLMYLRDQAMPEIKEAYGISLSGPGMFLEDTLGLALDTE